MAVVSVKVPEWVKEKMKMFSQEIDWPEEIRKFIIGKIEEIERMKSVEAAIDLLKSIHPAPKGTAEKFVREDRDSH